MQFIDTSIYRIFRRPMPLLCLLLLGNPAAVYANGAEENIESPAIEYVLVQDDEILALNDYMKNMVDTHVKSVQGHRNRLDAVNNLMFSPYLLGIKYKDGYTGTAIQTVQSGYGNCVALANTFIAIARYAGLKAKFLSVDIKPVWEENAEHYYSIRHMSTLVTLNKLTRHTVDFQWVPTEMLEKSEVIADKTAFAIFYNNLAVEQLTAGNTEKALLYLQKSAESDPKYIYTWTNLGYVYKRSAQPQLAEQAYLKALKLDSRNPTALNNLAVLYDQQNKTAEATRILAKIESFRRQNPYYLLKLAEEAVAQQNYREAIKLLEKAIAIKNSEHKFYFELAVAHYLAGNHADALQNMQKADELASDPEQHNVYAAKMRLLTAAH
jgi:Flp pilus assembly protein TadD